jgi:MFS family permease
MDLPRILVPLRDPGLRRLWGGQSFALLAAEFHLVALAWLALELTGSGLALGSVLVAGMLPRIVFTLAGGVAADRFDHRRIMVLCNACRALVVAGLACAILYDAARLWHLYLVGLLLGAITAFYQPALYTAVPRQCRPADLRAGNALLRGTAEALGAIGPVAGGALVAAAGVAGAFWTTAACYAIAFLAQVTMLRTPAAFVPAPVPGATRSAFGDLRAGAASLRGDRFLIRVLALISAAGLALTGPITVGVPWLAREVYEVNAAAFGLMLSMWTTGSLAGVVLAGSLSRMPGWRLLVGGICAVISAALAVLGLVQSLPATAIALLVMGTAAGAFNVLLLTWLQERTPPALLGRLMSFAELAEVITTPLSYLLAGLLLDLSVTGLFVGAAAVLLCSGLAAATASPAPPPVPDEPLPAGSEANR